jgi:hypothetical protein
MSFNGGFRIQIPRQGRVGTAAAIRYLVGPEEPKGRVSISGWLSSTRNAQYRSKRGLEGLYARVRGMAALRREPCARRSLLDHEQVVIDQQPHKRGWWW